MHDHISVRDRFLRDFYKNLDPSLVIAGGNMAAYYCQALLYELEKEMLQNGKDYVFERIVKSIPLRNTGVNNNYDSSESNKRQNLRRKKLREGS